MSVGATSGPSEGDQGGVAVPQPILERVGSSLEGIVAPEHRKEAVQRVLSAVGAGVTVKQTEILATQHAGPIPSPTTIEHYEHILPGSANRLIAMAERDQEAFIASNARQQWLDFSFNALCVVAGVVALGGALWATVYLGAAGRETAAAAAAALAGAGVIGAIVNARTKKAE